MQRKLTTDQEICLCIEYSNPEIKESELVKKYGISIWYLTDCRKRLNIPRRPKIKTGCCKINENYFENIDCANKAYHLGFITGDGNISKKFYRISFGLNTKDIDYLEKLKSDLESEHKITSIKQFDKRTNKSYEVSNFSFSREKLHKDLIKHGVTPNKSKELEVPKLSDDLMIHYLRGLIDSDGGWTLTKDNQISLSIVSSVLSYLEKIRDYMIQKIDLSNVKLSPGKGCWHVAWGGNIQCRKIYNYLYSDGGPWLNRKYELTTNYFNNHDNGIRTRPKEFSLIKENPKILSNLDRILGFGKIN